MRKLLLLLTVLLSSYSFSLAQPFCRQVRVQSPYNQLLVTMDKGKRVSSITGTEDGEASLQILNITYDIKGFPTGNLSMKNIKFTPYGQGYMIRNKEDERETVFYINQQHQIYQWQVNSWDEDNPEHFWVFYTYDQNGNCSSIICKAETSSSQSEMELKPRYDLTRKSVFHGDPLAMLPEMQWTVFPFTNQNLLTGFDYTQSISVPDKFIVLARDRKFQYQFDAAGRVIGIDAVSVRFSQHISLTYSDCQ